MIKPYEITNLLYWLSEHPEDWPRIEGILERRILDEVYEEDEKRSPRDYKPLCEAAYRK